MLLTLAAIPPSNYSKSRRAIQRHAAKTETRADEWPCYGRDPGGARYSPLRLIGRENVRDLEVAWIYRTGDVPNEKTA